MKRVICFDTSIATSNMGDYIIADSCEKQLSFILKDNFVLRFPTHTPISHWYQDFRKFSGGRYRDFADYKFLFGTNALNSNMFVPTPLWNINLFNNRMAKGVICVGVGMGSSILKANKYTEFLLKKTLNREYAHSTRDEKTAIFLRSMGFKAINTGCATTWNLTESLCEQIPHKKAKKVVFTLTDYMRDPEVDKLLIDILIENYERVYFWVQGIDDCDYLQSLTDNHSIEIIPPSLTCYDKILLEDVDYIGTRLHAGIRAIQKKKRSIIIEVDNRASDMKECISLNTIKRNDVKMNLEKMLNCDIFTSLGVDTDSIAAWKDQFDEAKQ